MVAHNIAAASCIDRRSDRVPHLQGSGSQLPYMYKMSTFGFFAVKDIEKTAVTFEHTAISGLTAALSIERGNIQHDRAKLAIR